MTRRFPWSRLGIDPTGDTAIIRKAYADSLRASDVDADIAGYAELRRARDLALQYAAQTRDDAALQDGRFGDLADDLRYDDDDDDDDAARSSAEAWDDPAAAAPLRERSESEMQAEAAWLELLAILHGDGASSELPVTLDECEQGRHALGLLLARAEVADLVETNALDDGLAELFARTWPRSAPFVEPANDAFGWLTEAGALEERSALVFLNQRQKGMRFHENVQRPDHPLNKAWAELSRPGRARVRDRLRVRRLDVHDLLTGIRDRYPELESLLDSERVSSWDSHRADGTPGGLGPQAVRWIVVLMLIGIVLARCGR
ncbi:hypothetical protein [Erythrobacter sp. R86502]|uniref:hypothetical protein n=1 Tax=Erythrobacter sp. R86502 TaxID=3093846 RepID=UPI0036D2B964